MLSPGQTAFLKISDQEVFILAVDDVSPDENVPFTHKAYVRFLSSTNNGPSYVTKYFYLDELESLDARVTREFTARQHITKVVETLQGKSDVREEQISACTPKKVVPIN